MTYCPNCGSGNIYLKRQTSFTYGAVGNRSGFVATGETDENYQNACMNCGHTWNAKELFTILKLVSNTMGQEIDLRYPNHRLLIQEVSQEMSSYFYLEKKLRNEVSDELRSINNGCICIIPFMLIIAALFMGIDSLPILGFGIFLVFIGAIIDSKKEEIRRKKQLKIEKEAEEKKKDLRYNFGINLLKIGVKHGLIAYELPLDSSKTFDSDWIEKEFGI